MVVGGDPECTGARWPRRGVQQVFFEADVSCPQTRGNDVPAPPFLAELRAVKAGAVGLLLERGIVEGGHVDSRGGESRVDSGTRRGARLKPFEWPGGNHFPTDETIIAVANTHSSGLVVAKVFQA